MDADVMITIAFGLEVAVAGIIGGSFIAREVRKARATESGGTEPEPLGSPTEADDASAESRTTNRSAPATGGAGP